MDSRRLRAHPAYHRRLRTEAAVRARELTASALFLVGLAFLAAGCSPSGGSGGGDAAATPAGRCLSRQLDPTSPLCTTDANGVPAYNPSAVTVAHDGMVYLLDPVSEKIYRWSLAAESHVDPIDLAGVSHPPQFLAHSAAHDRLYLGWSDGTLRRVDDPTGMSPTVVDHTVLANGIRGLDCVGDFLVVRSGSGSNARLRSYDAAGVLVSTSGRFEAWEVAWSPSSQRLYSIRDETVAWIAIDPLTGVIGPGGGERSGTTEDWRSPLVVSATLPRVALGSGHLLDDALATIDVMRDAFRDGVYLDDGSLLLVLFDQDRPRTTLLEHRDASGTVVNRQRFEGSPIEIAYRLGRTLIITLADTDRPRFEVYAPGVDGDGDGVPFADDAFPLDPAASTDSDGDGAPDAWNPDRTIADSTEGLGLDAFPFDTACQTPDEAVSGDPSICDIAGATPAYIPTDVAAADDGVVYVLDRLGERVHRWDAATERPLNPVVIAEGAQRIEWANAHARLYVDYGNGTITAFDPAAGGPDRETFLRRLPTRVNEIASAGDFLAVYPAYTSASLPGRLAILDAALQVVDVGGNATGTSVEFVPGLNRLYHIPSGGNSNRTYYTELDPSTGEIGAQPSFSDIGNSGTAVLSSEVLHVSRDGTEVAFGTGVFRDADDLSYLDRLPLGHDDAIWLANGDFVALRNFAGTSRIDRWNSSGRPIDAALFEGFPYAIIETLGRLVIVSRISNSTRPAVAYHEYVPGIDGDGDGVPFAHDEVPLDPAASVDSDGDGYPDAWHAGYSGSAALIGRGQLDAFPFDSACFSAGQGLPSDPSVCDIQGRVITERPDQITADDQGIVYLLREDRTWIERYSAMTERYLNPIVLDGAAVSVAWSTELERLYVGYPSGRIDWYDDALPGEGPNYFRTVDDDAVAMLAVGSLLVVHTGGDAEHAYYSFDTNGAELSASSIERGSAEFEFSPARERIYHTLDGFSNNPLRWEAFNPVTGLFGTSREWSYNSGEYEGNQPIRVSPSGEQVSIATGEVFDGESLNFEETLPVPYTDALWRADGRLATVRDPGDGTSRIELWSAGRELQAFEDLPGEALALLDAGVAEALVRYANDRPIVSRFEPNPDMDGDGVPNVDDGFPLDPAASSDIDGDGSPDAWNAGYGPSDSTTGLAIDAFPLDPECQLPAHGREDAPAICDIGFGIPPYEPADVVITDEGIVHALSPENDRIYRWSIAPDHHLDPLVIDDESEQLSYSSENDRLYVFYREQSPRAMQIDPRAVAPIEEPYLTFAVTPRYVQAVGPMVVVTRPVGPFSNDATQDVHDVTGLLLSSNTGRSSSPEYSWSASSQTMYYSEGASIFGRLEAQTLDPVTGELGPQRFPPHGTSGPWRAPVRAALDGTMVAMSDGSFHDGTSLARLGRLPEEWVDGTWLEDGTFLSIRADSHGDTLLEHWSMLRELLATSMHPGSPRRIVASSTGVVLITSIGGRPTYERILPADDADGDGILNPHDDFPSDPAASLDSDGDGGPDAWLPGRNASDSTTGLVLDAFPFDAICWLPEHAYPPDPTRCDFSRSIPSYVPDAYEIDVAGTAYFLDANDSVLRRWSSTSNYHLDPIPIGTGATHLTYSALNDRLYLGYDDGTLTQIDPIDPLAGESTFGSLALNPTALIAVDDHLFAMDVSGPGSTQSLFGPAGGAPVQIVTNASHRAGYAWSSLAGELLFPNGAVYPSSPGAIAIDTSTGTIGTTRTTSASALHIEVPLRLSHDGTTGIDRNGNVFDIATLAVAPGISDFFVDGSWTTTGTFLTIDSLPGNRTRIREWPADLSVPIASVEIDGAPLRVLARAGFVQVIVLIDGRPLPYAY